MRPGRRLGPRGLARLALLALLATSLAAGLGCSRQDNLLRAKQIESRFELVGGPVGMADIGDFLLENDQIRVAILGSQNSPGPGVFGGSLVDADLRRPFLPTVAGQGRDRFAETFPLANLLVPNPTDVDIFVLHDGSDGQQAAIRVQGRGDFFFEAISFLDTQADLLSILFGDLKTRMHFTTDYILRPGQRYVTIRSTMVLDPPRSAGATQCAGRLDDCELDCEGGLRVGPDGCQLCECGPLTELTYYTGSKPIFEGILGDPQIPLDPSKPHDPKLDAGVVAGDFVFFGNQNDIFGPGFGFDEEKAVFDAIFAGRDTFEEPLSFDFVAAAGGDVSYGYFTAAGTAEAPSRVNVPIFTAAATAFLVGARNCLRSNVDDEECDSRLGVTFERYLVIGEGDVASVAEVVFDKRGTPTGVLEGVVRWASTGGTVPHARVFLFRDPDPGRQWTSMEEVVRANQDEGLRVASVCADTAGCEALLGCLRLCRDFEPECAAECRAGAAAPALKAAQAVLDCPNQGCGTEGLMNAIFADRGIDRVLDGRFHARVAAGDYVVVARSEDGHAISPPYPIRVEAGGRVALAPMLQLPATVVFRVTDEAGRLVPAKVYLVGLDDDGQPLELDGGRRRYLGDDRIGNGIRELVMAHTGEGTLRIEPGRYRLYASRGPEYSRYEERDITLSSGQRHTVDAVVRREVATPGWASTDMHLHAQPSFDSGMSLEKRVRSAVVEDLDLVVATDHDVLTDYTPAVKALHLEPWIQTAVGAEISTLELGHYIGWPMRYDHLDIPHHGVHDWVCETGIEIVEGVKALAEPGREYLTVLAHPRDGFIGYLEQLGVDPFTTDRKLATLNADNVLFRTAACEFDAMEVFNGKRLDLVRTPTIGEVMRFSMCGQRVDGATTEADLDAACPEIEAWPLVSCASGERFADCQHRHRTALAWDVTKAILTRTPAEQAAIDAYDTTAEAGRARCQLASYAALTPEQRAEIDDQPCTHYSGHVDDFLVFTEHGFHPTQVGSSDAHGGQREPGVPRTYFQSPTDQPGHIDLDDAVRAIRGGQAFATYGPFVQADVLGAGFGEVADAVGRSSVPLRVQVQTPSWFGVDRLEVYLNGKLVEVLQGDAAPEAITDFDVELELPLPDGRDSWVSLVVMGLDDRYLLGPTAVNVPFGELQLPRVASLALAQLGPIAAAFLAPSPPLPDWFPIPPLAFTNPIYIDTDGNGAFDAPLDLPNFCSRACDPGAAPAEPGEPDAQCPAGQVCLPEGLCGILIDGVCADRVFMPQAMPDGDR